VWRRGALHIAGAAVTLSETFSIAEAQVIHQPMFKLMRNLSLALVILGAFALTANADVGDAAKLKTVLLDGKPVALDQLKGKVVMVNFWATWCPTCKAEMPQWQKFYDTYKGKGFELIAVSIDDDEKLLRDVCKERGFTFPVAWRYDDKTDDNFGDIIGTPTLYIVDKTGKVAWMKRGRVTYAQLQEIVEPLLK
jgi:thiol-disulfide isomerase/thioredoxin